MLENLAQRCNIVTFTDKDGHLTKAFPKRKKTWHCKSIPERMRTETRVFVN